MKNEEQNIWDAFRSFGKNGAFRLLAQSDDCIIIRVENETGEGDMIIHQVFAGVYLMYNDFHMSYYDSLYQAAETVLAIDYCREGSLTMECDNGFCQVKNAGSVCIDFRVHHKGVARFPTNHFHGITIGFENELAEKTLLEEAAGIPIDLAGIREKFCGKEGYFIDKDNETLKRLFTDLYHVPEKAKQAYFRAKVLELLVCLTALEKHDAGEKTYFYKDQVEKTNAAMRLITEDLSRNYTIEELAKRFELSPTALKNCFKSIYGKPIYTWLKEYRIQRAQEMLIGKPEISIGDIAFLVGYESAGKFSAAFKKKCGMTPKEYRSQPH